MADKKWAYEDWEVGALLPLGERRVTAEEIVAFAADFDPQPMHLDQESGQRSLLGGLAASGWHTCVILMRMMCDGYLLDSTSQGAPGVDEVRWKQPVLAGDTLKGQTTIVDKRVSKSRPQLGIVVLRHELFNQRGETVLEMQHAALFKRRTAA